MQVREGAATRVDSACVECRRRKDKCDGKKPVCSGCEVAGRTCEWRTPQKRGPPKNYIEALENRLREAESLLLSILPYVDVSQLDSLVVRQHQILHQASRSRSPTRGRFCQEDFSPTYWAQFPLNSTSGITAWWHNRTNMALTKSESTNRGTEAMAEDSPWFPDSSLGYPLDGNVHNQQRLRDHTSEWPQDIDQEQQQALQQFVTPTVTYPTSIFETLPDDEHNLSNAPIDPHGWRQA